MNEKLMKRVPIKHAEVLQAWAIDHNIKTQADHYSLYVMLWMEMWPNEYINRPQGS